ncbi:MAG: carbon-nitrogen family hydrolase [Candidatus Promineifilaceae bacterium]
MMNVTIALGQMDVQLGEPERNWQTVVAMAAAAAARQADILVLPELWSTGYDLENAAAYVTPTDQGIFARVADLARQHHLHILGSCLSLMGANRFGNTAVWFDPLGQNLATYSKIHLFRLMAEEQFLTAGEKLAMLTTPWGKAGLAICYDLRFPEMFRAYALAGARLVFLPSEWPHPRLAHWQTLVRGRAIENQMFLIACNRVGTSKNSHFFGHSCIIDPWGETVIEGDESPQLLVATINTALVDTVRAKIPVFADRRPELYEMRDA